MLITVCAPSENLSPAGFAPVPGTRLLSGRESAIHCFAVSLSPPVHLRGTLTRTEPPTWASVPPCPVGQSGICLMRLTRRCGRSSLADGRGAAAGRRPGPGVPWRALGPVPQRAPVGHGPRGLQRQRRRLVVLQPRPGAVARLPLGRGRPRRHLATTSSGCASPLALWNEQRPDPQGAPLRADQRRGQPRRGRQGVLLLRRQHADPLVPAVALQVPAGGVPVRRSGGHERAAGRGTSMEYELLDTGVFDDDRYFDVEVEYAKAGPTTSCAGSPSTTAAPRTPPLHVLPDAVVPQHLVVGARRPEAARSRRRDGEHRSSWPSTTSSARATSTPSRRRRAAVLRQRDQRGAAVGRRAPRRYPKDGINDHVVHGGADAVNPASDGHQGGGARPARSCPPAGSVDRARAAAPRRPGRRWPTPFADVDARDRARGAPRPTSSTPRSRPHARRRRRRRGHAPGAGRDAVVQAVLLLRRRPLAARARRRIRCARRSARHRATSRGSTWSTTT